MGFNSGFKGLSSYDKRAAVKWQRILVR